MITTQTKTRSARPTSRTGVQDLDDLLIEAEERLARWRSAGRGTGALVRVREALDDDLDVPAAIAAVDEAADRGEGVDRAAALLGVAA